MPKTSISWKPVWIYLKSQIEFWNLKSWYKSWFFYPLWKFISNMEPWSGRMCVDSTLSHDELENTHMAPFFRVLIWNKFSDRIKFFQIEIIFSNFKTQFEISNKFKFTNVIVFFSTKLLRTELCTLLDNLSNLQKKLITPQFKELYDR